MATLSFEPLSYDDIPVEERPTLLQALVPVLGMLTFLSVGAIGLGLDAHMPLLWGIVLTGLVGRYWIGISWNRMYKGIVDGLRMGMQAILIIFIIYLLIATWTGSGTIPALIYYGLDILNPQVFLPATALLAAIVAFAIGSSWTTAGTLGVAFIGIGAGLGVPEQMTAGAILTGAYTGDKISPLSDTTNLAAAVTNTDLMTHVRTMRVGTSIAMGISLVLYAILGLNAAGAIPAESVGNIQSAIAGTYNLSPLVFLPLLITFGLALSGFPALPALGAGIFAGVFTQFFLQGPLTVANFVAAWEVPMYGTSPETGSELVNGLLASGGVVGDSAWTITIVVAALSLGGILERTGVIAVLTHHLSKAITSVAGLTIGTAASALGMNILAAEQYMSIVVPGMSLRGLYDDFDLESRNLSRGIEAAGTTTSALIPWNAGAIYMTGVLGVAPFAGSMGLQGYAPYYFLGFLSPLILITMGLTGWRITKKTDETQAGLKGAIASLGDD
ncbi:arginine/ornithine antiporter ArcD [Haladaptatus sp. ZSTT2]|uniref:arginine/ornithine antiporter ArcD n=1 Tax=Haladaptatus sp. ZSTT2 TaxID=3120515 RepID=UPI00300F1F10